MRLWSPNLILSMIGLLSACAAEVNAPPAQTEEVERGSHSLGATSVLEHGPLWFGTRLQAEITRTDRVHAFTFQLSAPAELNVSTRGSAAGPDVDTVLVLYREGKPGTRTPILRSDDWQDSCYAGFARKLGAGSYRLEVRGKASAVRGPFEVETYCNGRGCPAPVANDGCIFGDRIADLGRLLRVSTILSARSSAELPDELARQQLVVSAQHTSEAGVASADELFGRVDEGLVRWFRIWDDRVGRSFRAFEYGLGNASYGAILVDGGLELASRITDGLLAECSIPVTRCRFGETYGDLKVNPDFSLLSASIVDSSNVQALSPTDQAQLLSAVRVAYEDAADLSGALESVDQGEVNRLEFMEIATGLHFVSYEYGAGDNSYGALFELGASELVARINDGDLLACTVVE